MELSTYQRRVATTDQRAGDAATDAVVHFLGLAGEVGSVAAEYKKYLRDGTAHTWWKPRVREELGDVLWYVASICNHLDLDLDEIADANLHKAKDRWIAADPTALDTEWPAGERLPRSGSYELRPVTDDRGRSVVELYFDGTKVGDPLTDASPIDDGYRFHDAFHISYAALLGWSPVTRALLGRKRRSNPVVDESEDGGRAIVIEEGVAALVFGYAIQHELLDGVTRLDQKLLDTIAMVTSPLEVGSRPAASWERAILTGFSIFRSLQEHNGGFIDFDSDASTMTFRPRSR